MTRLYILLFLCTFSGQAMLDEWHLEPPPTERPYISAQQFTEKDLREMKAIVHPNICLLTPPANRLVQYIFQNFEGPFAFSVKTSAFKPLAAQLTHPDFTLQNLRDALDALTHPR